MKLITFKESSNGETYRLGALVSENEIVDLTSLVSNTSLTAAELLRWLDLESGFLERAKTALANDNLPRLNRLKIELCAPVPRPPKIICVGLNYRDHAAESGLPIPSSPIIFAKFTNCAIGAGAPILLPRASAQVDYEAELAFVVGRRAKNVRKEDAMDYVLGYTNFNDVSARDFQFADGQWIRGKSCDSFAPLGEFIATGDEIEDPHNLRIQFRLNGVRLQDSNTAQLIFKIPELIEFLSASITLEAGDVVATGTPPGVGFARRPPVFMTDGDRAEVEIEGLGVLSNPVKSES
jgi:2-keto-4-pentenoate hydratase/2-oxohepta-3-ene-1,7-dioic acid hydratase in catechol pathway